MSRSVLLLTAGVVIAAAAVYLLVGFGDVEDPYEVAASGDATDVDLADPAATLQGTGTGQEAPLAVEEVPRGEHAIEGVVLDPEGKAVAGIRVSAHYSNPQWDDPDAYNAYYGVAGRLQRTRRQLEQPESDGRKHIGTTTTDDAGRFRIEGVGYGSFQVRAHPEPPLLSPTGTATISKTWQSPDVTLELMRGSALRGRVVDAADQPVAAVVKASWTRTTGGVYRSWSSDPVRSSEADGTFALPAVPDGKLGFTVTLPGKLRVTGLSAEAPSKEPVILRIPGGAGAVTGTVTDQEEGAVAGALVEFTIGEEGQDARAKVQTLTDASGGYAFAAIPTGTLRRVQVLATGFAAFSESASVATWAPFAIEAEPRTLDFKLLRGGTVHGRVLVAGSGEALADAQVYLFVASPALGYTARAPMRGVTNEDGAFRIEGVPGGRLVVIALHETHYLKALFASDAGTPTFYDPSRMATSPPSLTRLMPRNGSTIAIDLELEPGLAIEGTVLAPDGSPVEDAQIQVKNMNPYQLMQRWGINYWSNMTEPVRSDTEGRFTLASLPPGKSYELYAKKKGYAGTYAEAVSVEEGAPVPTVTLRLVQGATVRGRVVDENGDGIHGANINLWGQSQPLAGGRTNATTDIEGAFEITGLAAGDYQYWVQQQGFGGSTTQNHIKDLKEGEVREDIEIELVGGEKVTGTLVDSKGKPVKYQSLQLQVEGRSYHTNTDATGAFTFANVKAGKGQIQVNGPGSNKKLGEAFDVPIEGLELTYDKPPSHTIEGTILDADGSPVPLCILEIKGKGGSTNNAYYPGGNSQNEVVYGVFRRTVSGAAPYRVTVKGARGSDGSTLNLAPHSQTLTELPDEPIEIRLKPGKEITGTVSDTGGNAVAGVTVRAGAASATTDAKGRFQLGGLGASATIQVDAPKGYVKPGPKTAKAGDDVEITLQPGLTIRGRAFDPEGKPLPSGWINAMWKKAGSAPAGHTNGQVQAGGKFELSGIPEGVGVSITVNGPWVNGTQKYAPKTVKDVRAGTTDLEIHLGASVEIEGRVVDSEGNAWTGGWVYAKSSTGQWVGGMQQLKKDGAFRIGGLNAGETYEVGVQRMNGGARGDTQKVTAPSVGVVLRMAKTARITGRIEGGETKGFSVSARRASGEGNSVRGQVAADGSFTIDNVAQDGTWIVTATKRSDDRYAQSRPVAAGTSGVVLRLRKGESISGRVSVDGAGPDARVWVETSQEGGISTWTRSAEDGTFEVKGLPPGRYRLRAMVPSDRRYSDYVEAETGATGVNLDV